MEEFDYIIIGAGSAGCVLANRLSNNPKITVWHFNVLAFADTVKPISTAIPINKDMIFLIFPLFLLISKKMIGL